MHIVMTEAVLADDYDNNNNNSNNNNNNNNNINNDCISRMPFHVKHDQLH